MVCQEAFHPPQVVCQEVFHPPQDLILREGSVVLEEQEHHLRLLVLEEPSLISDKASLVLDKASLVLDRVSLA